MEPNPYQSPEPPEEQVSFREVGAVWSGWTRIRQVGSVLALLGIAMAVLGYIGGLQFGKIPSAVLLLMMAVGLVAAVAGRAGAYFNTVVNMFRGDYD